MEENQKYLYVMLSRTTTSVAKLIQRSTSCRYSHASLSLDRELKELYSFGRRRPHNVFIAGFIHEDLDTGVYSWNGDAPCVLYRLAVTREVYDKARAIVDDFLANYKKHKYNIRGLRAIGKQRIVEREFKYACSQFVAHVLKQSGAFDLGKSIWLARPDDFIDFAGSKKIYEGTIAHVRD